MEEWRMVPGFEGYYEISDKGRIRTVSGYMLKSSISKAGVKTTMLRVNGKNYFRHNGRLVAEAFIPVKKKFVVYLDGDRSNAVKENLKWSDSPNLNTHNAAKLNQAKADFIRDSDMPYEDLMFLYDVSKSTIQKIKQGLIWRR